MRVEKEIVRSGFFYLPDDPENEVAGTLYVKNGGRILLELITKEDNWLDKLDSPGPIPRIVGRVVKDGFVTLDKGLSSGSWSLGPSGTIGTLNIQFTHAYFGFSYGDNEEILFNTFKFSVDLLDYWLSPNNVKTFKTVFDQKKGIGSIEYSKPDDITIALEDSFSLRIEYTFSLVTNPSNSSKGIKQKAYFIISNDNPQPASKFFFLARRITLLMCFLTNSTVSIDIATAMHNDMEGKTLGETPYPKHIKIYYFSSPFSDDPPKEDPTKILRHQRFGEMENIIKLWLSSYERIEPTMNLYSFVMNHKNLPINDQFLSVCRALETLHRRTNTKPRFPKDEFESIRKSMIDVCSNNKHREWFTQKLKYANELNLRKRLKELIEPFKKILGNKSAREKLVSSIVDTRNYLTHFGKKSKDDNYSVDRIHDFLIKLELLLFLHILKLLGFESEEAISIAKTNHYWSWKIDADL